MHDVVYVGSKTWVHNNHGVPPTSFLLSSSTNYTSMGFYNSVYNYFQEEMFHAVHIIGMQIQ